MLSPAAPRPRQRVRSTRMQQHIKDFLHHLLVERGLAENTISAYQNDLNQFTAFLKEQGLNNWTQADQGQVSDFLQHLKAKGLSSASAARKLAAIKTFFHYLTNARVVTENPTVTLERPKTGRRPRVQWCEPQAWPALSGMGASRSTPAAVSRAL